MRFWIRFWSLFGSLLASIFSIFHDSPKTFILQQVPSETLIFTSQPLSFWNNFSIKFWCFSDLVFGHPCFIIFPTWYPKTWFLDPPWDPAGSKMAPKIGQVAPKLKYFIDRSHFGGILNRPCFSLNHGNYAAVGPYWILKHRIWMKVCTLFNICLIFRLYIISPFLHLFFIKQQ